MERVRLLAKEMVPELSDGLRLTAFIAAPMICSFCVRSTILQYMAAALLYIVVQCSSVRAQPPPSSRSKTRRTNYEQGARFMCIFCSLLLPPLGRAAELLLQKSFSRGRLHKIFCSTQLRRAIWRRRGTAFGSQPQKLWHCFFHWKLRPFKLLRSMLVRIVDFCPGHLHVESFS